MKKKAMYYKKDNGCVECNLCPRCCKLDNNRVGFCSARKAEDDELYSLNYGEVTSIALDPIEKKPLYHFKPGSKIISVGSFGCNFKCGFCQNASISQNAAESQFIPAETLVKLALEYKKEGNIGIAFTYNEPTVWFEYIYDTINIIKENEKYKDIDVVLVSNGYINDDAFKLILPGISAVNIDLKAFSADFYRNVCKGEMEYVKNSIIEASKYCHVEITNLIIEGYNDDEEEIEALSKWLSSINKDIPLHLSRYFPAYKFKVKSTSPEKMLRAYDIASNYLNYVYIGNMGDVKSDTLCPVCKNVIIKRSGYNVESKLKDTKCPYCGAEINIVL